MSAVGRNKGVRGDQQNQNQSVLTKTLVLKDYKQRLRDNIRSLIDNFSEIVKLAKVEEDPGQSRQVGRTTYYEQEDYEMEVRAANMARAAEALMKLVSDLKQFLVLHDFGFVNATVTKASTDSDQQKKELDDQVVAVREEITKIVAELEQEYNDQQPHSSLPALR